MLLGAVFHRMFLRGIYLFYVSGWWCVAFVFWLKGLKKNQLLYKKDFPESKRNCDKISDALDKCDWSVIQTSTN